MTVSLREELAAAMLPLAVTENDMRALVEFSDYGYISGPVARMAQDLPWPLRVQFNTLVEVGGAP